MDDGDFAGVGHLLADATFIGRNVPFTGRGAIETMLRDSVIVYENAPGGRFCASGRAELDTHPGPGRDALARSRSTGNDTVTDFVERAQEMGSISRDEDPPDWRSSRTRSCTWRTAWGSAGPAGESPAGFEWRVPDYPNAACEALKKSVGSYSVFTARNLAWLDP